MPEITYQGIHVKSGINFVTVPFFLRVGRTSVSSPSEGGTYDTSIYTHPDNPWTVTDSCTWIGITNGTGSGDGTFTISVSERAAGEIGTNSGLVTISSRAATKYISVTQDPIPDDVILVPDSCTYSTAGSATEIATYVYSTRAGAAYPWTAAEVYDPGGFASFTPASGNWGDPIYVTVAQSTDDNCRSAQIEVSCGTASAIFQIYQDGDVFPC